MLIIRLHPDFMAKDVLPEDKDKLDRVVSSIRNGKRQILSYGDALDILYKYHYISHTRNIDLINYSKFMLISMEISKLTSPGGYLISDVDLSVYKTLSKFPIELTIYLNKLGLSSLDTAYIIDYMYKFREVKDILSGVDNDENYKSLCEKIGITKIPDVSYRVYFEENFKYYIDRIKFVLIKFKDLPANINLLSDIEIMNAYKLRFYYDSRMNLIEKVSSQNGQYIFMPTNNYYATVKGVPHELFLTNKIACFGNPWKFSLISIDGTVDILETRLSMDNSDILEGLDQTQLRDLSYLVPDRLMRLYKLSILKTKLYNPYHLRYRQYESLIKRVYQNVVNREKIVLDDSERIILKDILNSIDKYNKSDKSNRSLLKRYLLSMLVTINAKSIPDIDDKNE